MKLHLPKFALKYWFWILVLVNAILWNIPRFFLTNKHYDIIDAKFKVTYMIVNTLFWADIFIGFATIIIPILQATGKLKTRLDFDKPWINTYQNIAFVVTLILLPVLRLYEVRGFDWQILLFLFICGMFIYNLPKMKMLLMD